MTDLQIYSPLGQSLILAPLTANAKWEQELMKKDLIHLEWNADQNTHIPCGAWVVYNGVKYITTQPYYPESKSIGMYTYKVDFHHPVYTLSKVPFLLFTPREDGTDNIECDWTFTGAVSLIADNIKKAINKELEGEYDVVVSDEITKAISLAISNKDIISTLSEICNQIEGEWWIDGTTIHLGKKCINEGRTRDALTLTAGQEIEYPSSNNKAEFYNRFFVYGSTRNIPQDYKGAQANTIVNKRLTLDKDVHAGGYLDLPYYDLNGDIEVSDTEREGFAPFYNEQGVVQWYRLDSSVLNTEKRYTKVLQLDDIYPRADLRVAHIARQEMYVRGEDEKPVETASGKATYNIYYVQFKTKDGSIFKFNPKTYTEGQNGDVIKNLTPCIKFNSGALQGRDFDIFNHYTKRPKINNETDRSEVDFSEFDVLEGEATIFEIAFKEDNTIIIPNTGIEPKLDDEAVVYNIRMPEQYVHDAYIKLDQEAIRQIYELSKDGNEYSVKSNQVWFAENNPALTLGRHVTLIVNGRSIDTRVIRLTTKLNTPYEQEIGLSKAVAKGSIQTIVTTLESTRQDIITTQKIDDTNIKKEHRRQYNITNELRESIFDTDGYFKDGNIKPTTIETLMLQVGAKSQAFTLSNLKITSNVEGEVHNANYVSWTDCTLTHLGLEQGLKDWRISNGFTRLMDDDMVYYIYAKCICTGTGGTIVISQYKKQWDSEVATENSYYFLIGTISSVMDGNRTISLTYGTASIVGDNVKAGKIKANNGKLEIDLDNASIYAEDGITFSKKDGTTGNVTDVADKIYNLKIGGSNLLKRSKLDKMACFGSPQYMYGLASNAKIVTDDIMGECAEFGESNGTSVQTFKLKANTPYCISWYARAVTKGSDGSYSIIRNLIGNQNASIVVSLGAKVGYSSSGITILGRDNEYEYSGQHIYPTDFEWRRYYAVIKVNDSVASNTLSLRIGTMEHNPRGTMKVRYARVQIEEGTIPSEWRESVEDIEERAQEYANSLKTTIDTQIKELEAQIDGEIEYFADEYGSGYEPTLSNAPANAWTTDEAKTAHIGDTLYNKSDGRCYRFIKKDGIFKWLFLENDPSAVALSKALEAIQVAGDKSTIMYGGTSPKLPCESGDMWLNQADKRMYICKVGGDTYVPSNWQPSDEYIEKLANSAKSTAEEASTTANNVSTKVDNLKVGGTNVLLNTADVSLWIKNGYISTDRGKTWVARSDMYQYNFTISANLDVKSLVGKYLCYSMIQSGVPTNPQYKHLMTTENMQNRFGGLCTIAWTKSGASNLLSYPCEAMLAFKGKNGVKYAVSIIERPSNSDGYTISGLSCNIQVTSMPTDDSIWKLDYCKLEVGNLPTDWSEAPEDIQQAIDNAKTIADNAKTSADKTASVLSKVDSDGIFSTIEKRAMQPQWKAISGNADTTSEASAGSYKVAYDNAVAAGYTTSDSVLKNLADAFSALRSFLNAVGLYSGTNYSFTTTYSRAELSNKFNAYHKAEIALTEATANKIATTKASNAESNAKSYADGLTSNLKTIVDGYQTQIDGKIEAWYYSGAPTLSNAPASSWNTDVLKAKHVGDLYVNTSTNETYRFMKSGTTYKWENITRTDPNVATALKNASTALSTANSANTAASTAQATANKKKQIFTTTPTPPYAVGDTWMGLSGGDIKVCTTARSSGSYVASDWVKASKYTDDTKANEAITKATQAETNAKRYADGLVSTANGKISQLDYLKAALAQAESGSASQGYKVEMKGGVVLSNVLEVRNTSGNVTAGMSGLDNGDASSPAFWAGASREDGNFPFVVHHNGEVEMTKTSITSGTQAGTQVSISTIDDGKVGVISVGAKGGADTQIVGKRSGGISSMLTNAGIGGTTTTINAGSGSMQYALPSSSFAEEVREGGKEVTSVSVNSSGSTSWRDYTILDNSQNTSAGTATLGNFTCTQTINTKPSIVYGGAFNANNVTWSFNLKTRVQLLVGNNKVFDEICTKVYFSNMPTLNVNDFIGQLNGKQIVYGAKQSIVLRISTIIEYFGLSTTTTANGSATAKGIVATSTINYTRGSYVNSVFNNIVYNDGYFMSRASNRYLAFSPTEGQKIMQMRCGAHAVGMTDNGLGRYLTKSDGLNVDMTRFSPYNSILWAGIITLGNGTASAKEYSVATNIIGCKSVTRSTSGVKLVTFTWNASLNITPIVIVNVLIDQWAWRAELLNVSNTSCSFYVTSGSSANYNDKVRLVILGY